MTDTPQRAHEYGEQAAMRGLPVDENPYRLHDLRAAWLRGWHGYQRTHAGPPIEATAEGRAFLASLKEMTR
ncbi:MAG: Rmf/CrpP family protein [Pseudomonadota bacterium]|nr:Rmf/CrpP family protein [Pseudomonadota bacterium]